MRRRRSVAAALVLLAACAGPSSEVGGTHRPKRLPTSSSTSIVMAIGHGWTSAGLRGPTYPAGSCHLRGTDDQVLPDATCTPGSTDRAVTQANLATTICAKGYTTKVRPPVTLTNPAKRESAKEYAAKRWGEYDHLIPLELGGSSDTRNLWLEPGDLPNPKDRVENGLKALVCQHKIPLQAAQQLIASDWTTAMNKAQATT